MPAGRRFTPTVPSGLWRATVARVFGGQAYITVPRLAGTAELGPCVIADGWWTSSEATSPAGSPDVHTHGVGRPLAAGDSVIVGFVEGSPQMVCIVARLAPGA